MKERKRGKLIEEMSGKSERKFNDERMRDEVGGNLRRIEIEEVDREIRKKGIGEWNEKLRRGGGSILGRIKKDGKKRRKRGRNFKERMIDRKIKRSERGEWEERIIKIGMNEIGMKRRKDKEVDEERILRKKVDKIEGRRGLDKRLGKRIEMLNSK